METKACAHNLISENLLSVKEILKQSIKIFELDCFVHRFRDVRMAASYRLKDSKQVKVHHAFIRLDTRLARSCKMIFSFHAQLSDLSKRQEDFSVPETASQAAGVKCSKSNYPSQVDLIASPRPKLRKFRKYYRSCKMDARDNKLGFRNALQEENALCKSS